MSKPISGRYQIPEKACHWETNFVEMRHKAMDYIKRHTDHDVHPIGDSKNYLIISQPTPETTPLCFTKIQRSHFYNHQNEFYRHTRNKDLIIMGEEGDISLEKSNLLELQRRAAAEGVTCSPKEDYHHILPPIYNLKLTKEERASENERRSAAVRQKLEEENKLTLKMPKPQENEHTHRRYHSIDLRSYDEEVRVTKSRAMSAFKRSMKREKVKTHHDHDRNIFKLPVEPLLNEVKFTAVTIEPQVVHKAEHSSQKIRKPKKEQLIDFKIQSEPIKQATLNHMDLQTLEENRVITIYGIEPKKQHNQTHIKRFHPHMEHRKEIAINDKDTFEKFEFTPWENNKQEAPNVLNFEIENL